jgi:hypothetical protein
MFLKKKFQNKYSRLSPGAPPTLRDVYRYIFEIYGKSLPFDIHEAHIVGTKFCALL